MKSDAELANTVPWMDKRILCTMLDQPYIEVPPGVHWLKPAVSEDGLGVGAERVVTDCTYVMQPEVYGTYLNIDIDTFGRYYITSAGRRPPFFTFFMYHGCYTGRMSQVQHSKCSKLRDTTFAPWINLEFIGDYCIEAHARKSYEFEWMYENADKHTKHLYAIPIWRELEPGEPADYPDVDILHQIDYPPGLVVRDLERRHMLYVAADNHAAVLEMSKKLNNNWTPKGDNNE